MWTTNGLINYAYDDGTDHDLTVTMTSIVELNASDQVMFTHCSKVKMKGRK